MVAKEHSIRICTQCVECEFFGAVVILCFTYHVFRAAETSQDIESLRPPRFIHEDGVIRPYKEREGLGSQMLQVGKKLRQQLSSSLI